MKNEFPGTVWTEEDEEADHDEWARRILTCVRQGCRRNRKCLESSREGGDCPMLKILPMPEDRRNRLAEHVRALLIERLMELNGELDAASLKALRAERAGRRARRRALAFQRVEAELAAASPKGRKRGGRQGALHERGESERG